MFNTLAKAKLVYNKKVQAYKLVVAFNVHTTTREDKDGNEKVVHLFPVPVSYTHLTLPTNREV